MKIELSSEGKFWLLVLAMGAAFALPMYLIGALL